MKRIRVIIIGIVCISLVVGYYYFLSNKGSGDETEVSEVQKVILKDIGGKAYPATPREVVKFYNRIQCCYYNEEYTEDEFKKLADQARILMDEELADNNPAEQYYLQVKNVVDDFREKKKTINNASVCDSNQVKNAMRLFLKKRYENGSEIFAYLVDSVEGTEGSGETATV